MASADQLPLRDYDQLGLGDLRHRIRSLDEQQLRTLFDYENAHANRVPVLELLHARLGELQAGATPSGGDPARAPRVSGSSGGSPVQQATAAEPRRR